MVSASWETGTTSEYAGHPASALTTVCDPGRPGSDPAGLDLALHPRDHLVEHRVEAGLGGEAEHLPRLAGVGQPHLHVVRKGRLGHPAEGARVTMHLGPDQLGELEHRRRDARREVEVLVARRGMEHGDRTSVV